MTNPKMSVNVERKLMSLIASSLSDVIAKARLGKSYDGDRDIYEALGYKKDLTFADYLAQFRRQGIAKRAICAPISSCWRKFPEIIEAVEEDTQFEKALGEMEKALNLQNLFMRLDKLASLGRYAVLLIGFRDGMTLDQECKRASEIQYLQPYSEASATISAYDDDVLSPRFGQPTSYSIKFVRGASTEAKPVHWSRVIHVAEEALERDFEGTPQLEACFNDLKNLEMISCGSAEMFWRGALPGWAFKLADGAELTKTDKEDFNEEIQKWLHNLQRFIRLKNIDVQSLVPQVSDPSPHIDKQIELIAAARGIPQRILMGSERGELASSQDSENWMVRIDERRRLHCEPNIIRPFLDRCIAKKTLPEPKKPYEVKWPELLNPSDKERAEIAASRSSALASYANSVGADTIVPPEVFLKEILGLPDDVIEVIDQIIKDTLSNEVQPPEPTPPEPQPADPNQVPNRVPQEAANVQ